MRVDRRLAPFPPGHRRDRLNDFDLPGDEVKAIMSIKADNLDQLIHKIGDYIYASGA